MEDVIKKSACMRFERYQCTFDTNSFRLKNQPPHFSWAVVYLTDEIYQIHLILLHAVRMHV